MSHHTHYISNFRVAVYDGQTARILAYVQGLGRAKDGNEVIVHVRYTMDCVRVGGAWKIESYWILKGMPMPGSLEKIHGAR
jgi:hypothetical protein